MTDTRKKSCGVYVLPDSSIVIQGHFYEPISPCYLASNMCIRLHHDLITSHCGMLILDVLEKTQIIQGEKWHENSKTYKATLFSYSGYKNYKALEKDAEFISISSADSEIIITPTERDYKHGGYIHIVEKQIKCISDAKILTQYFLEIINNRSFV